MRQTSAFLLFTLFISLLPFTAGSLYRQRNLRKHSLKKASFRQHPDPSSVLDVCVSANADLLVEAMSTLDITEIAIPSNVHLCLCTNHLPAFLETDAAARAFVHVLGFETADVLFRSLIHMASHSRACIFPPHSHSACHAENLCRWECDEGWVKQGNRCTCPHSHCSSSRLTRPLAPTLPSLDKDQFDFPLTATLQRLQGRQLGSSSNLNGDLLNRLGVLFNLVSKLRAQTDAKSSVPDSRRDAEMGIALGCVNILDAATVRALIDSIVNLVDLGVALNTTVSTSSVDLLPGLILHTALGLRNWCTSHPILADGSTNLDTAIYVDVPVDLPTLGLLDMDSTVHIATSLGADVNTNVSSDITLTSNIATANDVDGADCDETLHFTGGVLDHDLSAQLKDLVEAIIALQNLAHHLLPATNTSSHNTVTIAAMIPILDATVQLLHSFTEDDLLIAVRSIGDSAVQLEAALDGCACIRRMHLGPLLSQLIKVINIALNVVAWCEEHSVIVPGPDSTAGAGTNVNVTVGIGAQPLIANAGQLLASLGLGGQGFVSAAISSSVGVSGDAALGAILQSVGLGSADTQANATANASVHANTDIVSNLLVSTNALLGDVLTLRLRGNSLAGACGCSPTQGTSPPSGSASVDSSTQTNIALSILTNINSVLGASLDLSNVASLLEGLSYLEACLSQLNGTLNTSIGAGVQSDSDVGTTTTGLVADLAVAVRNTLGSLTTVQTTLDHCGCSKEEKVLSAIRLVVGNMREALVGVRA